MKMHEMDLIEFLIKEGHTDIAESIKDYRKNTIKMCVKDVENVIAKGTSKIGGFPDLPPEIPYPTMSGYSCKRGDDTERYEKSAMQLVAQINLADIADLDIENKLPHTGILYFFWSGEIDSIHQTNKWVESIADAPENSAYHKVIWYNGDLANLKRTEPPVQSILQKLLRKRLSSLNSPQIISHWEMCLTVTYLTVLKKLLQIMISNIFRMTETNYSVILRVVIFRM